MTTIPDRAAIRGLTVSDRDSSSALLLSDMRRARPPLRPELAAPLGVCPSSLLGSRADGRAGWWLSGDVAVLGCCTAHCLIGARARRGAHPPTVCFSGRTYPKLARIVRALCAVAGRCWWLLPLLSAAVREPAAREPAARREQTVCVL
jgi:hypothetical protein